jgi:hypothetical protein
MRFLKVLGVAMFAALALAAVSVASASAAVEFKAESTGAITGTQSGSSSFTAGENGTITCSGGMFRGMITSTSTPTQPTSNESAAAKGIEYTGCKFLGIINVAVNPNECQYTFHAATPGTTAGTADVGPNSGTCASTGITFAAAGCTISIFPQTGINNIKYTNNFTGEGSKRDITLTPSSTNIHYTAGSGCTHPGAGTNGTYTNASGTTITGATATPITESSTMVGIWVE